MVFYKVKSLDDLTKALLIVILFLGTSRQSAKFEKHENNWKDLEKEFMISAVKKLNVEEVEIKEKSHHDPTLEETCKPRALCLGEVLVPPSWRLSRSSSGSLCDTCSVST